MAATQPAIRRARLQAGMPLAAIRTYTCASLTRPGKIRSIRPYRAANLQNCEGFSNPFPARSKSWHALEKQRPETCAAGRKGQHIHPHAGDIDAAEGCSVDPGISSDPKANDFGLSLGGHAYYVIGMHENACRRARRFPAPVIVFNMRQQFSRLRESGHFETMSQKIKQRDIAYAGSANPMLARHGEVSEARQYSGRTVGGDWRCPFSRKEI
jgi:hypothetical protein